MSYRQSLYPGSALAHSNASTASSGGPSPAHLRLVDKQREFTAFAAICQQASQLATFLDEFATRYETLDGGSEGASTCPPLLSSTRLSVLLVAKLADS